MDKRQERQQQILQAVITILSRDGAEKLSMRSASRAAGLSLSNLQYYYRDKDSLLIAAAAHYFESCKEEMTRELQLLQAENNTSIVVFLHQLLDMLLVDTQSDTQIVMFQEIRALSSRNKELEKAVEQYYKNYCAWLMELIASFADNPKVILSLLVPYAEGYPAVSALLPLNKKDVIQMLVKVILSLPA